MQEVKISHYVSWFSFLSDRGETYLTSATLSYRQVDLEEKGDLMIQSMTRLLVKQHQIIGSFKHLASLRETWGDLRKLKSFVLLVLTINIASDFLNKDTRREEKAKPFLLQPNSFLILELRTRKIFIWSRVAGEGLLFEYSK